MGPYMRPIPIGATAAMVFSLIVAFMVTPWAAVRLLEAQRGAWPRATARTASRGSTAASWAPLLAHAAVRWSFLAVVAVLLLGSMCARLHRLRQGEDAAVRQQERVPGDRRHARGHHARGDRARHAAAGRTTC